MTQSPIPPTQRSLPSARLADLLPPTSNTELALILAQRLVLTLVSGAGLILVFAPFRTLPQAMSQVLYLTTISSILVFPVVLSGLLRLLFFLTFPARRKLEGNLDWLRGPSTCVSLLADLVSGFIIVGDLSTPTSSTPYLALPVVAVIDWILVNRNQSLLPWWVLLTWILSLVPYLLIYTWDTANDKPMYTFSNPTHPSQWPWVATLSVGLPILAYAFWGTRRLHAQKRP